MIPLLLMVAALGCFTLFVMWIIGFVDVIRRTDMNDNEKLLWGLGMFFVSLPLTPIYFFVKNRVTYGIVYCAAFAVMIATGIGSFAALFVATSY